MQPQNQTDHVALLALMISGVLIKRLNEVGQLDEPTAQRLHRLIEGVRLHATHAGLSDLTILFDNIDHALGETFQTSGVA